MKQNSSTFLRLLLNRYHQGNTDALLKFLPEEQQQAIRNLSINSDDLNPFLKTPKEKICHIHYSWLIPTLREKKESRPLLLALLPKTHQKKLQHYFKEKPPLSFNTPLMERLFGKQLEGLIDLKEYTPIEYLETNELTPLLHLNKNQLVDLVNYLALYDLADEIHHIVDKTTLQRILSIFDSRQKNYLKRCLHTKQRLASQRLNLEQWDGDPSKLKKVLHHRGLMRLGYALSGQESAFNQHIIHTLDNGRGEKLQRYIKPEAMKGVTGTLRKQILHILNFFKKVSAS